jgi:tetratricopeptide (TPR) repeat protein
MDSLALTPTDAKAPARPIAPGAPAAWAFLGLALLYLLPPLALWVTHLAAVWRAGSLDFSSLGRYVHLRDQPEVLLAVWPVLLALFLWRTGWPQLLAAAALALLALGLSDLTQAVLGQQFTVGVDGFWRAAGLPRTQALVLMALRGLITVGTAIAIVRIRRPWKRIARRERGTSSQPPAIAGRLCLLLSAILFVAAVGRIGWIGFTQVALRDPQIRWAVAAVPPARPAKPGVTGKIDPEQQRVNEALSLIDQADVNHAQGKFAEARRLFSRGLNALNEEPPDEQLKERADLGRARGLNNLAWLLCTCPDETFWNSEQAVTFSRKAVELSPREANYWNTLGVALFRAGEFEEARTALEKSMSLADGGGPHDWLFLAQIEASLDHPNEARRWFDRSEKFLIENGARLEEIGRFYAEAAEILGAPLQKLRVPPPPPQIAIPRMLRRGFNPLSR